LTWLHLRAGLTYFHSHNAVVFDMFVFQIGRTENIKDSLSPEFSRSFELDYYFEQIQRLLFAVYDMDNSTPQVSDDDFLGQIDCTLGEV